MNNIFIAHTPYHLILDTGLAEVEYKKDNNFLLVFEDFDTNEINFENLENCFCDIMLFDSVNRASRNKKKNIFCYLLDNYKMILRIKKVFKQNKFNNVFIHNDCTIINKKIMQLASSYNSCKLIYIEDGGAAYDSGLSISNGFLFEVKWMLKKILFRLGKYGEGVQIIGSSNFFNECRVLFPEYVREELKTKNLKEISKYHIEQGLLKVYSDKYENIESYNNSIIIFLDLYYYIEQIEEKYLDIITKILQIGTRFKMDLYIKYHPRESFKYLEGISCKFENIKEIINNQPIELIYNKMGKGTYAIGNISTGLITLEKISPKTKKVSIMNLLGIKDQYLREVFIKTNVLLLNKLGDLISIIENEKLN